MFRFVFSSVVKKAVKNPGLPLKSRELLAAKQPVANQIQQSPYARLFNPSRHISDHTFHHYYNPTRKEIREPEAVRKLASEMEHLFKLMPRFLSSDSVDASHKVRQSLKLSESEAIRLVVLTALCPGSRATCPLSGAINRVRINEDIENMSLENLINVLDFFKKEILEDPVAQKLWENTHIRQCKRKGESDDGYVIETNSLSDMSYNLPPSQTVLRSAPIKQIIETMITKFEQSIADIKNNPVNVTTPSLRR